MRWCGSKILRDGTANRISWQNQWWSRPESFRLIFTGVFHDIFIRTWPVYEFNKLLLSPPRFRRTLIVYFQLIMKILLQKLILMSQPPKQSAVGSWENSSEVLSSWRLFGSERAEPQRTIPFFAEIARRSLAEREGGNIQILKSLKENTDKGVKGRFVFVFVHFVFSGYFITQQRAIHSHWIRGNRKRSPRQHNNWTRRARQWHVDETDPKPKPRHARYTPRRGRR